MPTPNLSSMSNLLVINYAMDENDSVFPHQIEVVRQLAKKINQLYVITNKYHEPKKPLPSNVQIFPINWQRGRHFTNVLKIILVYIRVIKLQRSLVLFSHMTEVQSSILALFTKVMKIRHILWYAHKSRSVYLRWCSLWIDTILTSTRASCPLENRKVRAIGQAVDDSLFTYNETFEFIESHRWIHVGRIDPSKNIMLIIEQFHSYQKLEPKAILRLVGSPTPGNEKYLEAVEQRVKELGLKNIELLGKRNQIEIIELLRQSDLFIHAFQGSLDKTLVEATMVGIPVVTYNLEFRKEFFGWQKNPDQQSDEQYFHNELKAFLGASVDQRKRISISNHTLAVRNHSQKSWISHLLAEIEI